MAYKTMLIQITNPKAIGLLHELEALHLIKVLKENTPPVKAKLSDKYRGAITTDQGKELTKHINQMRNEWSNA
jgi:hypothetical protein